MSELILYTTEDARSRIRLRAKDPTVWRFPLLTHAGKVSHTQMERAATALYLDYDQRRKQEQARQANAQDEAELKALENTLQKRHKL
ncbi:hypothetical protein AAFN46_20065 [Pseudomonas sp. CAU 1711]|uniref:hypothetical protein n=1 Tax=Pseudomonas sp. CAU 1711 TaxID=3140356 RepID=UPI003261CB6E